MVIQLWIQRGLLGPAGLLKPRRIINVENKGEQGGGGKGHRFNSLSTPEQAEALMPTYRACVLRADSRNPAMEVTPWVLLENDNHRNSKKTNTDRT